MSTKKYNPITPSLRYRISNSFAEITTNVPEKSLLAPNRRSGGRNQKGEMTMRYIGGGHKKQYRIIDFKRNKFDIPATVKTIEYDPNRSAFIALVVYKDGEKKIHHFSGRFESWSGNRFRTKRTTGSWKYVTVGEYAIRFSNSQYRITTWKRRIYLQKCRYVCTAFR